MQIQTLRLAFTGLLALATLAGCGSRAPSGGSAVEVQRVDKKAKKKKAYSPDADELDELVKLSKAVVVGVVEETLRERGALIYLVRVREVLVTRTTGAAHPHSEGSVLRLSSFLFNPNVASKREIGGLLELGRYLFFLAPKDKAEEWFNLDDAARYALPEAQETLDRLRTQKGSARPPSKTKLPIPSEEEPPAKQPAPAKAPAKKPAK